MFEARQRINVMAQGAFLPAVLSVAALSCTLQSSAQQHYTQTNLVSAKAGVAAVTDKNLVNPWGLSRASNGEWWVADEGSGLSTLYNGAGTVTPLVVTIPAAKTTTKQGTPTGTVFNGGTGFQLTAGKPADFLFVTEDGTISGWNSGTKAVIKVNDTGKSVYMGATIANNGGKNFLYVADFLQARIQVFDTNFAPVAVATGGFTDTNVPKGYAPFNVQNIGGNLYVAYAMQNSAKDFSVEGAGLGYVDIYSAAGKLLLRLQHGDWFNAPWGLALASGDFGSFSHDILVGQFGSGQILAFNPINGAFHGTLMTSKNTPITIGGLWALSYGNGTTAGGPATSLYFTAAADEGLLGTITAVENIQGNDQ